MTGIVVVSIILGAAGLLAYALIGERIIYNHRKDKHYKRKRTVRIFNFLFIVMALEDVCMLLYMYESLSRSFLTGLLFARALVIIITLIMYWLDIKVFSQKNIPEQLHQKKIEKIKQKVITELSATNISESFKNDVIRKINKYEEA